MTSARKPVRAVPPDEVDPPAGPFDLPVDRAGLSLPRLRVLGGDGVAFEVQAYNPDLIAYEQTAARHRWPGIQQAPFMWLTFLAWSAGKRAGHIDPSVTWDLFSTSTLEVTNLTNDDDRARPTPPAPAAG